MSMGAEGVMKGPDRFEERALTRPFFMRAGPYFAALLQYAMSEVHLTVSVSGSVTTSVFFNTITFFGVSDNRKSLSAGTIRRREAPKGRTLRASFRRASAFILELPLC